MRTEEINAKWDKEFERMAEDRRIRCPHCQKELLGEDTYDFISYHGEEGPQETDCPYCEKTLFIQEHVDRTYDCTKDDPDTV